MNDTIMTTRSSLSQMGPFSLCVFFFAVMAHTSSWAQTVSDRLISGVILTDKNETVEGASIIVRSASKEERATSDSDGVFSLKVPGGPLTMRVEGRNIDPIERSLDQTQASENLTIR